MTRWLVVAAALLGGCASLTERADAYANLQGWESAIIDGQFFRHQTYQSHISDNIPTLHVYIEGDGRPWSAGGLLPSHDPTPANALALRLMAKDDTPALYLGRPCYFGLADDGICNDTHWTSARYSDAVVSSMAAALNGFIGDHSVSKVVLIGYSGGGVLAVLMAPRINRETEVLTLAANLDINAWTQSHNYLPLKDSINPMNSARLEGIVHRHLAGTDDRNVALANIQEFSERHTGSFSSIARFDHLCCWEQNWPQLLRREQDLPAIHTFENEN